MSKRKTTRSARSTRAAQEQKQPLLLPSVAEQAPMDNAAVWLTQGEVECLYGIGRTKFFAMQRHDGRFFRHGKTTKTLLDGFACTHPNFTVREAYEQ